MLWMMETSEKIQLEPWSLLLTLTLTISL